MLTLRLNSETIEKGKAFAKKKGTGLSKLTERRIDELTEVPCLYDHISPFVKNLSGVIKKTEEDPKSGYSRFLKNKYM